MLRLQFSFPVLSLATTSNLFEREELHRDNVRVHMTSPHLISPYITSGHKLNDFTLYHVTLHFVYTMLHYSMYLTLRGTIDRTLYNLNNITLPN